MNNTQTANNPKMMITPNTGTQYRISAQLDRTDGVEGYNVHDYFRADLDELYPSRAIAEAVAQAAYLGPDVDGIGCTWEVVDVEVAA